MAEISVDFPALGNPMIATSARSFSSIASRRSSPARPGFANRGAWRVGVAKCWLPQPPFPPRASAMRSPAVRSSPIGSPVSASAMTEPSGSGQHDVAAGTAVAVRALAVLPALGVVRPLVPQVVEGVERRVGDRPDGAAVPPVAAGGPAPRDELLPAEGDAAVAAVAPLDVDFSGVDEHGSGAENGKRERKKRPEASGPSFSVLRLTFYVVTGSTEMIRPSRPRSLNRTMPATCA